MLLIPVGVALASIACSRGGTGCLSLTGCGADCIEPGPSQRYEGHFAAAPTEVVDADAPVIEGRVAVGGQVSLILQPVNAHNLCRTEVAIWTSTNPGVGGFEGGNPNAGTYAAPHGDAVFHAIAPGDTVVYVTVNGVRSELVYFGKKVEVIHVVAST